MIYVSGYGIGRRGCARAEASNPMLMRTSPGKLTGWNLCARQAACGNKEGGLIAINPARSWHKDRKERIVQRAITSALAGALAPMAGCAGRGVGMFRLSHGKIHQRA